MANMYSLLTILYIFYLFQNTHATEETITVLRSQLKLSDDGKAISGAKLINDKGNVSVVDISVCIRFNYKLLGEFHGRSTLVMIEDWKTDPSDSKFSLLNLGAGYPYSFLGFGFPRANGSFKKWLLRDPDSPDLELWASNIWSHVCLSYEKRLGLVRVVKDGKVLNSPMANMSQVVIPADFLYKVYVARCNYDYKKLCSGPDGQVSDFNIWGRALSAQEMQDWTTCRNMLKGDLVNWSTAKFDLANMTVETQPISVICLPSRPGHVLFPEKRTFLGHRDICQKMRGVPSVIRDNATQNWMCDQANLFNASCGDPNDANLGAIWTGWLDELAEGHFLDINSGQALESSTFAPWYVGEPNGDIVENCVYVPRNRRTWSDASCNKQQCSFCELERSPILSIRGLCADTKFDTRYSWTRTYVNNRHSFRGYTGTFLSWDVVTLQWRLELYSNKSIYATTNITEYPLGTQAWKVTGDVCHDSAPAIDLFLNINACNSSEFNCASGHCIDMEKKCDGKVDCVDKSDEVACKLFSITEASNLRNVPPPPAEEEGSLESITVNIDILSILSIKEMESTINLQLELRLTWNEVRLYLMDLKHDHDLNTLAPDLHDVLWIPVVVFSNTKEKLQSLNDEKALVTIARNGSYKMNPKEELHNARIFKGKDNPFTISRIYDVELLCQFEMTMFPFDTQRCSVELVMKGNSGKFVHMVTGGASYLGPTDLTQYFIKSVEMLSDESSSSSLKADIIFGRRVLGTILTTYMPTILICIVGFSTNYFRSFYFEAIVTVNLTALLVLVTLFIGLSYDLPKTAYVKMIDVWLVFNLLIPFAEVLLHTYMDYLNEDGIEDEKKKGHVDVHRNRRVLNERRKVSSERVSVNRVTTKKNRRLQMVTRITREGLPLLFATFLVVYFAVAMIYYYNY